MFMHPHEEGQGLAEYGLILILVAIVVVVLVASLGAATLALYTTIVQGI